MVKKITPLKAIKEKCKDCMCGQLNEVALCPHEDCSLYAFRMGSNPNRGGIGQIKNISKKRGG